MTQTVNNATFDCGLPDGAYMLLPGKLVDLGDGQYEMRFKVRQDPDWPRPEATEQRKWAVHAAQEIMRMFGPQLNGEIGLHSAVARILLAELKTLPTEATPQPPPDPARPPASQLIEEVAAYAVEGARVNAAIYNAVMGSQKMRWRVD